MKKKRSIKLLCLTVIAALVISVAAFAAYAPDTSYAPDVAPQTLSEHVSDDVFLAMLERVQRFDPNVIGLYTVLGEDGIVYYHPIFPDDYVHFVLYGYDENFIPNVTPAEEPWSILPEDLFEPDGSLNHEYVDYLRAKGIPIDYVLEFHEKDLVEREAKRKEERNQRSQEFISRFLAGYEQYCCNYELHWYNNELHFNCGNHTFGAWTYLGNSMHHRRECTTPGCTHSETANHNRNNLEDTGFGFHRVLCSDCGRIMSPAASHTFTNFSHVTVNNHRESCPCGFYTTEPHSFNWHTITNHQHHGTCNCTFMKTETHSYIYFDDEWGTSWALCTVCGYLTSF